MSVVKRVIARLINAVIVRSNGKALAIARKIVPLPIKRRISRLLTSEITLNEGYVTSKCGHKFVAIREPVFLQVRYEGTYEKHLSKIAKQLATTGDTVIDVGANFGWYSVLLAAEVGEKGRVFSFEPNIAIYPTLVENIEINNYSDRVHLRQCGVGDKALRAVLSAGDLESAIGFIDTQPEDETKGTSESVDVYPLDDLVAEHIGEISFIKVDVEGFESFVLQGAKKIFAAENPPAMLMEFNIEALERQNIDIDSFIADLQSLPASINQIVSGRLEITERISKENADLIFLPTRGKYQRTRNGITL